MWPNEKKKKKKQTALYHYPSSVWFLFIFFSKLSTGFSVAVKRADQLCFVRFTKCKWQTHSYCGLMRPPAQWLTCLFYYTHLILFYLFMTTNINNVIRNRNLFCIKKIKQLSFCQNCQVWDNHWLFHMRTFIRRVSHFNKFFKFAILMWWHGIMFSLGLWYI